MDLNFSLFQKQPALVSEPHAVRINQIPSFLKALHILFQAWLCSALCVCDVSVANVAPRFLHHRGANHGAGLK